MADNQDFEMGNGEEQQEEQQDPMNGDGSGDNNVSTEAPGKDDDRKLFVGGLSWETTDKELREHFSKYGEIESINVKTDPTTGRSRGFAFLVFKTADTLDKILNAGDHVINNKKIDPKRAKARHGKIFVGGLVPELTDDDIKAFFGNFGNIVEVEMPFDKQKNQRKGFCFITFDSEQVVKELLKTPKQTINGKEVDVKKVLKTNPRPDSMPMRGRGGRGGGGRGRGGAMRGGRGRGGGGYGGGYGDYYGQGYDYYGGGGGDYGGYGGGYGGYDYSGYGNYGGYGGGAPGGYGGGKQRGGGRGGGRGGQRHQPY